MKENIFSFLSYKTYLSSKTGASNTKRGVKTALAKALGCQPTYISQVLHGTAHLSLEQAEKANSFFSHTDDEEFFFLLLVQMDRAGTRSLKKHFRKQIDDFLNKRLVLTHRLGPKKTLGLNEQAIYYSSWIYSAVHIALTIPKLRSQVSLSEYFSLPIKRIKQVLEFLYSVGLAEDKNGTLNVGSSQVRLGKDSHNILKHHTNWRNQAMESLEREEIQDMHYSGVVSLSRKDVIKIKNILLDAVDESQNIIKHSKEEELCALNIDFFSLKKGL